MELGGHSQKLVGGGALMRTWGCLKISWCKRGVSEKLNSCQGGYLKKEENALR